jgi:hypothetical protein
MDIENTIDQALEFFGITGTKARVLRSGLIGILSSVPLPSADDVLGRMKEKCGAVMQKVRNADELLPAVHEIETAALRLGADVQAISMNVKGRDIRALIVFGPTAQTVEAAHREEFNQIVESIAQ